MSSRPGRDKISPSGRNDRVGQSTTLPHTPCHSEPSRSEEPCEESSRFPNSAVHSFNPKISPSGRNDRAEQGAARARTLPRPCHSEPSRSEARCEESSRFPLSQHHPSAQTARRRRNAKGGKETAPPRSAGGLDLDRHRQSLHVARVAPAPNARARCARCLRHERFEIRLHYALHAADGGIAIQLRHFKTASAPTLAQRPERECSLPCGV